MKRYYSYAGVNICIEGSNQWMYKKEGNLSFFRKEKLEDFHHFIFEVVDCLREPVGTIIAHEPNFIEYKQENSILRYVGAVSNGWEKAYMCVKHIGKNHYVSIKESSLDSVIPVHTVYEVLQSEKLMAEKNTVIMHASYIEYKGQAILFTAPSGTGKSTQAELWKNLRGARILNGDRCAIQLRKDGFYVCGVPFAGSSNICENVTLPLKTIVCLSQAPKTSIERISGFKGFRSLYEGCGILTWDKKHVEFVTDFIQKLLLEIPVYHLACTPDESAVIALEEKIRE